MPVREGTTTRGEQMNCPFCELAPSKIWLENQHAVAIRDNYPVSDGHTLVVPKQHVASMFDLPEEEQEAMWRLAGEARSRLLDEYHPDGFNVGLNDGVAAGQTVMHVHIHVIPRYKGDVADPRGGIRWVIPDKAPYWT